MAYSIEAPVSSLSFASKDFVVGRANADGDGSGEGKVTPQETTTATTKVRNSSTGEATGGPKERQTKFILSRNKAEKPAAAPSIPRPWLADRRRARLHALLKDGLVLPFPLVPFGPVPVLPSMP